jgi:SAM-dependent methyltransferase
MKTLKNDEIRQAVRKSYGKVAQKGIDALTGYGCDCGIKNNVTPEDISKGLGYSSDDVSSVPDGANMGLGCGNPQAIASLKTGETVLDLGSGGGFDCFLAAKAVGETGNVIGVDMTPEMISKARKNAEKTEYNNVEFRLGEIENLPAADSSVDVIISNCVINLAPDKEKVYQDTFRVLKSGGRLAISDVVTTAQLPDEIKSNLALYSGCIAGALQIDDLKSILEKTGFVDIRIKLLKTSKEIVGKWLPGSRIDEYIDSATVEAVKP